MKNRIDVVQGDTMTVHFRILNVDAILVKKVVFRTGDYSVDAIAVDNNEGALVIVPKEITKTWKCVPRLYSVEVHVIDDSVYTPINGGMIYVTERKVGNNE